MENTGSQTSKCLRCGRTLRAASSVRASYGRWCRAKIRAAAVAAVVRDFTGAQVEKAPAGAPAWADGDGQPLCADCAG